MKRLVIASGNLGKLREFDQLLAPRGWESVSQASLEVKETDEPFGTFVENALRKARNASIQTGLPALADDSGICVPALGGAPGVYSARYASRARRGEGDHANNKYLVAQLKAAISETDAVGRADSALGQAYYYCVLAWVDFADDPCPKIAEGRWWGEVIEEPKGNGGFGYDSHFLIPSLGLTVAQMTVQQKNEMSHRAQALQRLVGML